MSDRQNEDRDPGQRPSARSPVLKSAASILVLLITVALYSAWRDPHPAADPAPGDGLGAPSRTASSADARALNGGVLWQRFCAACHVAPAAGVAALGPVLLSREYLDYATDRHLDTMITRGVPATMMTPWGGRTGPLSPDAVGDVITYMRSVQPEAPSDPQWKRGRTVVIP